jgi:hypothetical protein
MPISNVIVTTSNIFGMPAISPDPIGFFTEEGQGAYAADKYLPSIYQGTTFSIDLTFSIEYSALLGGVIGTLPAESVTSYFDFNIHGITTTYLSNNVIRLSGTYVNAFTDEYYNFVLKDMSQAILLPTTDEDFLALIEYNMPNPVTIENHYLFDAVGPLEYTSPTPTTTVSGDMFQWIVWKYPPTVTTILDLVSRGV